MKKNIIQDERVLYQKRKIGSDAFVILYLGLLLSILIQQFVFDASFSQYAAEFILLMVAAVYVVVRNIIIGSDIYSNSFGGQKLVVINSIVCGATISAITAALNVANLGMEKMGGANGLIITSMITLICGAVASFVAFEVIYIMNKKRQKQIDDKYIDTEE